MRITAVILKNSLEQMRSIWVLLLTLLMGPFFLFVYYLIIDSYTIRLDLLVLNLDPRIADITGSGSRDEEVSIGLLFGLEQTGKDTDNALPPVHIRTVTDSSEAVALLKNGKADALLILGPGFSSSFRRAPTSPVQEPHLKPDIELIGDLRSTEYLLCGIWADEMLNRVYREASGSPPAFSFRETALGSSAVISEFEAMVPGLLILSIIMLMFSAGIAFVTEAEHKTLIRLRLAEVPVSVYTAGVSAVQLLIGLSAMLLTLGTALLLGAEFSGSLSAAVIIASLCSLSVIAFSLILAAFTKNANEILVLGNFPMFLFMFFSGAAFPMSADPWFEIAGYPLNLQSLMSPTHAVSALHKTLVLDVPLSGVMPEILSLLILTAFYGLLGGLFYRRRHLR